MSLFFAIQLGSAREISEWRAATTTAFYAQPLAAGDLPKLTLDLPYFAIDFLYSFCAFFCMKPFSLLPHSPKLQMGTGRTFVV